MKSLICALLVFFTAVVANAAITLEGTTDSLEIVTSAAGSIDYDISWSNVTATALTTPGTNKGNIATATTTTAVAAPSASNWRYLRTITIYNVSSTVSNSITIQKDVSATNRIIAEVNLGPGEYAVIDDSGKLTAYNTSGNIKTQATDISGYNGRSYEQFRVGATSEAIGLRYFGQHNNGNPGVWAPGTPGLNGTATECDQASEAALLGVPVLPDPATGRWFLTQVGTSASTANTMQLIDILWYNTGLVVGTTTAQSITQPAIDARDINGTTNGEGLLAALYTTVTGTGGACTTGTISYTDQDGNAGNTGTMANWPATAVAGTFVPFELAAGDRGIRSIQSVTLSCVHTTENLILLHYRPLVSIPNPVANVGGIMGGAPGFGPPGVRIFNNSCIAPLYIASATTATTYSAIYSIMER